MPSAGKDEQRRCTIIADLKEYKNTHHIADSKVLDFLKTKAGEFPRNRPVIFSQELPDYPNSRRMPLDCLQVVRYFSLKYTELNILAKKLDLVKCLWLELDLIKIWL